MVEKGYWFSLENGTHIHAEEGESPKEATQKKLKSFKNPKEIKAEQTSLKEGIDNLVNESKEEAKKDNPLMQDNKYQSTTDIINEKQKRTTDNDKIRKNIDILSARKLPNMTQKQKGKLEETIKSIKDKDYQEAALNNFFYYSQNLKNFDIDTFIERIKNGSY